MAVFQYVALNSQGQEQQGSIDAADTKNAVNSLRAQALFVVSIEDQATADQSPLSQGSSGEEDFGETLRGLLPISGAQKIFFIRQLALMLKSGLTLIESLDIAYGLTKGKIKNIIKLMSDEIKGGANFSNAIDNHGGDVFSPMAMHMIRSAEASGELDVVLERISEHMERRAELIRNLVSSMTYPLIVLIAAIGMSIFLIVGVIPEFSKFFARTNKPLPEMTQQLMNLSAFVESNWYLIMALLAVCIGGSIALYRTQAGRNRIDAFVLLIPIFGKLITSAAMAQVGWALAMLLRSGVSLLEALLIASDLIENRSISGALRDASEQVLAGRDLSSSLQSKNLPELLTQLAGVGERSGSLDHLMQEVGSFYEGELNALSKTLSTFIEPVLILVIGGMVGVVYYAFFEAIFSVAG
ncbi:MAG: type II secretion system F family protein [Pseudomonadales bacterium]|nr:type II secretion system F family protein [Pseudomonadales bacterium]